MEEGSVSAKSGLGRSLGSLIPDTLDAASLIGGHERVEQVPLTALQPGEEQPRTLFDEKALAELAQSIKRHGVVQPLVVSPLPGGRYGIIAGERRWRAAKIAKLKTVPVLVRSLKQQEKLEVALIENVQRVDLEPLDQAASIERLHQQFNLHYSEIAARLGRAETTVVNTVRLLQLPPKARQALQNKRLSEGHARQVLALKNMPEAQDTLVELIEKNGWSVRQAEQFVVSLKAGHKKTESAQKHMAAETPETKKLSKRYGVPVKIYRTAKGGRLELSFRSDDELAQLLKNLSA